MFPYCVTRGALSVVSNLFGLGEGCQYITHAQSAFSHKVTIWTLPAGRSELLRLTRHVELMVQVENLFRSRLLPQAVQRLLLRSIAVIGADGKPTVSIYPNSSHGFIDRLFLFLSRTLGARRLLIKIFEMLFSGFIAPEQEPSLPKQLINAVIDVALWDHELDKRDRMHLRVLKLGATGRQHLHKTTSSVLAPPSQVTATRNPSVPLRPSTLGVRASWRFTYLSEADADDNSSDFMASATQSQCQPLWTAQPRGMPDPNARLEELQSMVLQLQNSVQELGRQMQEFVTHGQRRDIGPATALSLDAVNEVVV